MDHLLSKETWKTARVGYTTVAARPPIAPTTGHGRRPRTRGRTRDGSLRGLDGRDARASQSSFAIDPETAARPRKAGRLSSPPSPALLGAGRGSPGEPRPLARGQDFFDNSVVGRYTNPVRGRRAASFRGAAGRSWPGDIDTSLPGRGGVGRPSGRPGPTRTGWRVAYSTTVSRRGDAAGFRERTLWIGRGPPGRLRVGRRRAGSRGPAGEESRAKSVSRARPSIGPRPSRDAGVRSAWSSPEGRGGDA